MLYQVSPADGTSLIAVAAVRLLVALLAALVPARATTKVDPGIALRAE